MAYGFRHIPPRQVPERHPHCSICHARLDTDPQWPLRVHLCKLTTFGTAMAPTAFLKIGADD